MTADDLLWEMKPQTEGKHLVLRKYLDAWFPILGFTNGRILYIEAFAGPGEYTGGEDGSPVIALKAFEEHNARKKIDSEILFAFIDADADRIAHLAALVAPFEARQADLSGDPLGREQRDSLVEREPAAGEMEGRRRRQVGRQREESAADPEVR